MSDFTSAQLTALKAAYAKGVKQVSDADGNSVTYASMAEMERAIARIERELAASTSPSHVNPVFSKGV